jgi:hypothetical protein
MSATTFAFVHEDLSSARGAGLSLQPDEISDIHAHSRLSRYGKALAKYGVRA